MTSVILVIKLEHVCRKLNTYVKMHSFGELLYLWDQTQATSHTKLLSIQNLRDEKALHEKMSRLENDVKEVKLILENAEEK